MSGIQTLLRQFRWPPLPEQTCPLLSRDVRAYSQEVVWHLRDFRATNFSLRHMVGSRASELFVIDVCALMRSERRACRGTQENRRRGGEGTGPS